MIDQLLAWDTDLFLWINSHHTPTLDWVMWTASQPWSWAVVLILLLTLLTLRYEPRRWWLILIAGCLCFFLSDRISVLAFKDVFHRLRPCHVIDGIHMFRTNCGGQYGFVSSHAANVLAITTFFIMRYAVKRKSKSTDTSTQNRNPEPRLIIPLLTLWAVLVCYSRPYLGKHYPGDVLCGALLGIIIGIAVHFLARWIDSKLKISEKN